MSKEREILLVEDNPGDVLLARKALKRSAVEASLRVVRDGREAVQYLRQQGPYSDAARPDLVLLDINLPGWSGHDVLRQIKTDESLRAIPVVMMSSSDQPKDIRESYANHANSYITKPARLAQLADVLTNLTDYWFGLVRSPQEDTTS